VYAAKIHRSLLIFAMALAIPALFERIVLPKFNASAFSIFNVTVTFVFDVVIVVLIFRHVFATEQPTSETIFGALCIYLPVGFSFASAYGMLAAFQPNAFYLDPRRNLSFLHHDFARRCWDYPCLVPSAFLFYPRGCPWRPVRCRHDRRIDRSLPPQVQHVSMVCSGMLRIFPVEQLHAG
jgi:hypothetical protein